MLVLLSLLVVDVRSALQRSRGVQDGLSPHLSPLVEPRFGTNVALEQYGDADALRGVLFQIDAAGLGTVRQRFAWEHIEPKPGQYAWEPWDRIVEEVGGAGLQLVAVLDTTPAWARAEGEVDNRWAPPLRLEDYASFAAAFAERYGDVVAGYQIWDQPNIAPYWGSGDPNPGRYVEMLRLASEAIRSVDEDAVIVAGGLAPNIESSGPNLSDVQYLREMYRRGAGEYMDALGVRLFGFWTGPYDRRTHSEVLNLSRVVLLREEMERRGDGAKPVWALDGGWCALPSDWGGETSPQGSDTPYVQTQRTEGAIQRIREEWPWMSLACLLHWQPDAAATDPIWGFALNEPIGTPRSLYEDLRQMVAENRVLYPGVSVFGEGGVAGREGAGPRHVFWGTDLTLESAGPGDLSSLQVVVDGLPLESLGAGSRASGRVWLARGLPEGLHEFRLEGSLEQLAAVEALRVGRRVSPQRLLIEVAVGVLAIAACGVGAWRAGHKLPWRATWLGLRRHWDRLPRGVQAGLPAACLLMATVAPPLPRLGLLALFGLGSLFRPDVALLAAVACIPLAPLHVRIGPGSFSLAEVTLLIAVGAWLWNALLMPTDEPGAWRRPRLQGIDLAVVALVCLSLAATLAAEYQRVAWREFRVVLLESAMLYALVRGGWFGRGGARRMMDVLWVSGVGVALYALARYPLPEGVIEAEGVRRAHAFYGSPNNLALVLERILPVGVAVALWGRTQKRRLLYGLGTLPMALALVLTFSRGALLLGLPAALMLLVWIKGGRWRWVIVGVLLTGVAVLATVVAGGRLQAVLDASQGTTFLRVRLWEAAWDMVRDYPWLGVGPDNFLYYYGDYIRPGAEVDRFLSHPHNLILDFWLRLGIAGVLLAIGLLGGFIRRSWGAMRVLPHGDRRAMVCGLMAGMAAAVAHGMVDSSFFVSELALWFMLALAWPHLVSRREGRGL
ncbi:MAG: O-antigen ligase family protein [Anaerolineae bacterium]